MKKKKKTTGKYNPKLGEKLTNHKQNQTNTNIFKNDIRLVIITVFHMAEKLKKEKSMLSRDMENIKKIQKNPNQNSIAQNYYVRNEKSPWWDWLDIAAEITDELEDIAIEIVGYEREQRLKK